MTIKKHQLPDDILDKTPVLYRYIHKIDYSEIENSLLTNVVGVDFYGTNSIPVHALYKPISKMFQNLPSPSKDVK